MNDYNGIVKDITKLISVDMKKNDIQIILAEFEKVMVKYNIEKFDAGGRKTDMRQLCETMLLGSLTSYMSLFFSVDWSNV